MRLVVCLQHNRCQKITPQKRFPEIYQGPNLLAISIIPKRRARCANERHVGLADAPMVGAARIRPLVVVHGVEEDPQRRAVDHDVRAARHVHPPGAVALWIAAEALSRAVAEGWVAVCG